MKNNLLPQITSQLPQLQAWDANDLYKEACHLFKHQQWEKTATILNYLCSQLPHFKQARFKLGISQMQLELWSSAQYHFEQLLDTHKPDADILCNLAICHWQQQHIKSALRILYFNLKQFPHHTNSLENLASLFLQFNRSRQAITLYKQILSVNEKRFDIRFNLAATLQQQAIYDEAILNYQILLNHQHQHPDYLYNLGSIYYNLGQHKAAKYYWLQSLKINPTQKSLQFMVTMLDQQTLEPDTHHSYVEELFNSYAHHYDEHLTTQLNYQLPNFLTRYLKNKQYPTILEIGCGTGLCGPMLQGCSQALIGIDLSQAMIDRAQKKKNYSQLVVCDALSYLDSTQQSFDLIVAMDVIPYINDLSALFNVMTIKLKDQGEILISVETNTNEYQRLEPTGRITYHPEYIHSLCKKMSLKIMFEKQIFARTQDNLPVMERIFHLKRNA